MRELETKDTAERVAEGSVFSSGLDTLSKYLRAVFMLLVVVIALLLIWFFTFSGFFTVKPDTAVITLRFGKFQNIYTESWHWVFPYPVSRIIKVPTNPQYIVSSSFMPANKALITNRKAAMENGGSPEALKPGFARETAAPAAPDGSLSLRILLDRCSAECFERDGRFVITGYIFPSEPYGQIEFFAEEGSLRVTDLAVYPLVLPATE